MFDASAVVSAALRENSVPERALLRADEFDVFALSDEVDAEIADVLSRPRFAVAISAGRRTRILDVVRGDAAWFNPSERRRPSRAASLARRSDPTPCGLPGGGR